MATPIERKMAQLQREKDAGYKQISFHIPPDAAAHLKALVGVYGKTQAQVLVQALEEAHERQAEEELIAGLIVTDPMRLKEAAFYLLEVCSGDRYKAGEVYLKYLQRKHPRFKVIQENEEHREIANRYIGVKNEIRKLAKLAEKKG